MTARDAFARALRDPDGPALDVGYALVAEAVLGSDEDTRGALDDLSHQVGEGDARHLMGTLFGSGRLRGDVLTYDDPANSFIHLVLERGVGIPLTLSVIAIEVGKRVGVQLVPVGMPGHFILGSGAVGGSAPSIFYDPFHGGEALTEVQCRDLYRRVSGLQDWDPAYLSPVDNRGVLLRCLNNLKSSYRRRDRLGELRTVMALRATYPELAQREASEFARLMRTLN